MSSEVTKNVISLGVIKNVMDLEISKNKMSSEVGSYQNVMIFG